MEIGSATSEETSQQIQQYLYMMQGVATDVYYREGYGWLAVPVGMELIPTNVIYSQAEVQA